MRRYFLNLVASPIKALLKKSHDNNALLQLGSLPGPFIPYSNSAIRPSGLLVVLSDIVIIQMKCIFELGSGISTIYIARLLNQHEGHLYSIEHDQNWFDWVEGKLNEEKTDSHVTIITAPLVKEPTTLDDSLWYHFNSIKPHLENVKIDLLLVDGPPAHDQRTMLSRYPAVPVFKPYFSDQTTVILDDIGREGETSFIAKWKKLLSTSFDRRETEGGIAIGYMGSHLNI